MSHSVKDKPSKIRTDNQNYKKRFLNVSRSLFKAITGIMDSDEREYFNKIINRLNQGQLQIENLMNQVSREEHFNEDFNKMCRKIQ